MVDSVKKYVRKSDIEKDFANFSEYSILLPENWFDDIKEDEINSVKKKIRDTFDYTQKKVKSDNPNYSYLLRLFALGYRYPRIKQWLDNLINEFKLNLHRYFEENSNRMAFVFHKMSAFGELPFDIYIRKKSNIIPFLLFDSKSHEDLTNDEKEECLSFFVLLSEIFTLNTLIKQRLDKIEKNILLPIESYHVGISDLYNYLEKLDDVFKRLVNSSILNKPVKIYENIRNSIIHAHFVPDWSKTVNDKGKRLLTLILVEWDKSNWESVTSNRLRYKYTRPIQDSTTKVFTEMTIIVSIVSQIISLYVFFSQSE